MLKKALTILFLAAVLTMSGLGLDTDAMAGDYHYPDDTITVPGDYSCSNFNIQLIGVSRDHGEVFQYRYIVTGAEYPISKISLLEFGLEEALVATETEKIKVFPPGAGGLGNDNWLQGVPQLQVLDITAQSYTEANPLVVYVSGTGGNIGTVAAHTKAGRNSETCFIQGPVTGLPVDASVPSSKVVVLNGVEYCINIDPRTGCPYPEPIVYECTNPDNTLPLDPNFVIGSNADSGDVEGPTSPTFIGDINSDMRCPMGKAAHNPCQWVILSGSAYGPYCW